MIHGDAVFTNIILDSHNKVFTVYYFYKGLKNIINEYRLILSI